MDPQPLLRDHSDHIDNTIRRSAQRRHLSWSEFALLVVFVRQRLADNSYEVLRKFQRSSIATYLAVVIERLALDYSIQLWQGWMPSTQARRLGAVAVLLERLMLRDKQSLAEAIRIARRDHGVMQTNKELRTLWSALQRAKN